MASLLAAAAAPAWAQEKPPPLSPRAQAADANGNGVIDRDEAGGPLAANFDEMDCNKSSIRSTETRSAPSSPAPAASRHRRRAGRRRAARKPNRLRRRFRERAQAADANGNGVIDRDEAGGPLAANFDEMDCDKSNSLDGNEIRAFFTGAGCKSLAAAAKARGSRRFRTRGPDDAARPAAAGGPLRRSRSTT